MKEIEGVRKDATSTSVPVVKSAGTTTAIFPCWMLLRRHKFNGAPFVPSKRNPAKMRRACTACGRTHAAGEVLPPK